MASPRFFPPDTRSSVEKLAIIERGGQERMQEMAESEEFQSFGYQYWDKPDATAGYGGYRYDGRYQPVATAMVEHYRLEPGDRVFEVGCGKGFLLVEFHRLGMDASGVDLSNYAVEHCHEDLKGKLIAGDFLKIDIAPHSIDLVLVKDTLPHFPEECVEGAVRKCMEISRKFCFFEVEVARNTYEQEMMYKWDITHVTRKPPQWWVDLFKRVGYRGDFHFKVLVADPLLPSME